MTEHEHNPHNANKAQAQSLLTQQVLRQNSRAALRREVTQGQLKDALSACEQRVQEARKAGRILTASLFCYETALFLYCESVDSFILPETLLAPLTDLLQPWPASIGEEKDRLWVAMQPVFYHAQPGIVADWQHPAPEQRRGRIALLPHGEKWQEYVYHHLALVQEGLLCGDCYQLIALHENVLFSYLEEPRTPVNLRGDTAPSKAIDAWLATDPESHFLRFAQGQSETAEGNFVWLNACFSV